MATKVTKVELVTAPDRNGKTYTQEFPITQAEAILRMPLSGGWRLPEKSKYERDADGTIRLKPTTGEATGAKASGDTAKGGTESK